MARLARNRRVVAAVAAVAIAAGLAWGANKVLLDLGVICPTERHDELAVLGTDPLAGAVPPGADVARTYEQPGCEPDDFGRAEIGVEFTTSDDPDDVFAFYDKRAREEGWRTDGPVTGQLPKYACYTKDIHGVSAVLEVHPPSQDNESSEYFAVMTGPHANLRGC